MSQKEVLKFSLNGDLRRRTISMPFRFSDLEKLLIESFDNIKYNDFEVQYVDDEGDKITVTNDNELKELFKVSKKLKKTALLKVRLVKKKKQSFEVKKEIKCEKKKK